MRCPSLRDLPPPPVGKSGWPWTEESPPLRDEVLPRVSIVTPSYNQAEFLEETIRSILLQGYPDLEYFIMDGGSTDDSVDIIRRYEPWLTYWISTPDHGQTHAINQGWELTSGDLLAYINSDDCYLKGTIASIAEYFHSHRQAGMFYGTAIVVDETGKELRTWNGTPFDLGTMLTVGNIVPQPTTFFSKEALNRIGYLDEKWHMIMDYELCIRVGLEFPTVCIPKTLAMFRDHSQSKTHMHFDAMAKELINWIETFSPKQIPADQLNAMKHVMLSRIHYEWALNDLANEREHPFKGLGHLIESIIRSPQFAWNHSIQTAYIFKEVVLAFVMAIRNRETASN
jgi:glycosyltransferase involved in cell wall biosynthesis